MTPSLLVYTRTTGYRHDSIPAGVGALSSLDGYSVDATEDPAMFRAGILRDYAAIVFLSTPCPPLLLPFEETSGSGPGYLVFMPKFCPLTYTRRPLIFAFSVTDLGRL